MSVLLETSQGDIVIDLLVDYAPKLCENFLKLCKIKYYNYAPVHSIQKSFSFQTGDPLGPLSPQSDGGSSIWGVLSGDPARRTFPALFHPKLKHVERGTVGMATVPHPADPDVRLAASQFIVSLGDDSDYLDGKSAIFGRVVEGFDVLEAINDAMVDDAGYPLVDIRIKHTVVLDDPYPDPDGLVAPPQSPPPSRAQLATVRLGEDDQKKIKSGEDESEEKAAELEKTRRAREARAQALTLEMMGDLPFAEVKPPENVLFVCKLNPVTQDADLELIFSRFGTILSCEVIRDPKTGDSLQYAFVEFEDKRACETAYYKMQDVLIDDRRIHVDFSQSVSKLSDAWRSDTNTKRQRQKQKRGGWGGVQELEKWRKYRNEDADDDDSRHDYDMVHDADEMREQAKTAPAAEAGARQSTHIGDRGPYQDRDMVQDRDRDRDRRRDRARDREEERGRDGKGGWRDGRSGGGRRRSRSSSRKRYHGESRPRDPDKRRSDARSRSRSPRQQNYRAGSHKSGWDRDARGRDDRDRRPREADRRGHR